MKVSEEGRFYVEPTLEALQRVARAGTGEGPSQVMGGQWVTRRAEHCVEVPALEAEDTGGQRVCSQSGEFRFRARQTDSSSRTAQVTDQ